MEDDEGLPDVTEIPQPCKSEPDRKHLGDPEERKDEESLAASSHNQRLSLSLFFPEMQITPMQSGPCLRNQLRNAE
jgi:hypothetical protein